MITIIHFTRLLYATQMLHVPVSLDTQLLSKGVEYSMRGLLSPKQDGFCQNGRYALFAPRIMKNGRENAWRR